MGNTMARCKVECVSSKNPIGCGYFAATRPSFYGQILDAAGLPAYPEGENLSITSYGVDFAGLFRQSAGYIDRILKVAKPAEAVFLYCAATWQAASLVRSMLPVGPMQYPE